MKICLYHTPGTIYYVKEILSGVFVYHREDGPAIEHIDGTKEWHVNGARHRLDGPALLYYDRLGVLKLGFFENGKIVKPKDQ